MKTLAVLCAVWGSIGPLSQLLQLRRTLRLRSANELSLTTLGCFFVGYVLWLAYGLGIGSTPLVVADVVGVASTAATIGGALLVRRRTARLASAPPRRRRSDPLPDLQHMPKRRKEDWAPAVRESLRRLAAAATSPSGGFVAARTAP